MKTLRQQIDEAEASVKQALALRKKAEPSRVRRYRVRSLLLVEWADGLALELDYVALRDQAEANTAGGKPC